MTKKTESVDLAVINTKLEYISNDISEIKRTLKESLDKQDAQESRLSSLESKNSLTTWALIGFTTIATAIASWLGMKD